MPVISAGVRKGQSVHHVMASRADQIMVCEKTVYRYVGEGLLDVRRHHLPQAPYRKPRKSLKPRRSRGRRRIDRECLRGRTFDDWKAFMEGNPRMGTVEIDSVVGKVGGKCLLTMNLNSCGLMLAFLIPSIWNVVTLVKDNNFERSCNAFISGNRLMGRTYIYDHEITKGNKRHLLLMLAGQPLDSVSRASLETAAAEYGITPDRLELSEHMIGMTTDEMHSLVNEIYERTDAELDIKNAELDILRSRIEKLTAALDSLGSRVDSLSAEGVNPSPGRKVVP